MVKKRPSIIHGSYSKGLEGNRMIAFFELYLTTD